MNKLHTEGYTIIDNFMEPEDTLIESITKQRNKGRAIFNANPRKTSDKTRVQWDYINPEITQKLKDRFPTYNPSKLVVIRSKPGCQQQAPHTDYDSERFIDFKNENVPCSCIIALMDNTTITIWKKCMGTKVRKGIKQDSSINGVYPTVVPIKKGSMLVFRGDLVHAGSAYETENYRVHCYLETEVPSPDNQTYLVRKNYE